MLQGFLGKSLATRQVGGRAGKPRQRVKVRIGLQGGAQAQPQHGLGARGENPSSKVARSES